MMGLIILRANFNFHLLLHFHFWLPTYPCDMHYAFLAPHRARVWTLPYACRLRLYVGAAAGVLRDTFERGWTGPWFWTVSAFLTLGLFSSNTTFRPPAWPRAFTSTTPRTACRPNTARAFVFHRYHMPPPRLLNEHILPATTRGAVSACLPACHRSPAMAPWPDPLPDSSHSA